MFVLITYDISNPRRLRQAGKIMIQYGTRVQYSVYECRLNPEQFAELICKMKALINRREDKVYCYPLCDSCRYRICTCGDVNKKADAGFYVW